MLTIALAARPRCNRHKLPQNSLETTLTLSGLRGHLWHSTLGLPCSPLLQPPHQVVPYTRDWHWPWLHSAWTSSCAERTLAGTHYSFSCIPRVPPPHSMECPRTLQSMPPSVSANPLGYPCGTCQELPVLGLTLAPTDLPGCPVCGEPWENLGCTHFSYPARLSSTQRTQRVPHPMPTLALAVLQEHSLCREPQNRPSPCPLKLWPSHQGSASRYAGTPMPVTALASQPKVPGTQYAQGMTIHTTIPSSLGEIAMFHRNKHSQAKWGGRRICSK